MNLSSYLEQHKSIRDEINWIQSNLTTVKVEEHAEEIALHINQLSGKLKIHLMNEDKFLYPSLIANPDMAIKQMAIDYQNEMGDLQERFKSFKDKYNVKSKLLEKKESFVEEAKVVICAIEDRILKEEKEIYLFI
ncbi:hemerythrin domain-containing protein [Candidatus Galacturonibacter soehngenii]|uniref:Hemerythrin domain-containing protein n=1 Tax=Candidatus Galacturonatibacter soehngenii TaxID=2307010 RepID=A0A7V7QMW2_9FIRM|nr:hemerythrin domain-containing protein [Candidatus Galacturonibacter soehngenii]KAB1440095.1 hemerythrin domain-containing protein [Candidatus Galacturonibacter soehngenii]